MTDDTHTRHPAAATTLVIDTTSRATIHDSLSTVDADTRSLLRDVLTDIRSGEHEAVLLQRIREEVTQEFPDGEPVGVVFTTTAYDDGHYLGTVSVDVLLADGRTDVMGFSADVEDLLADEYGKRGPDYSLAVDLRTGKIDGEDDCPLTLAARFSVRAGAVTPAGRRPDPTHRHPRGEDT